jgi:hypothetical protein
MSLHSQTQLHIIQDPIDLGVNSNQLINNVSAGHVGDMAGMQQENSNINSSMSSSEYISMPRTPLMGVRHGNVVLPNQDMQSI